MMKQIIAMGGGGFSMEPDNLLLDEYVLAQSSETLPYYLKSTRNTVIEEPLKTNYLGEI